MTDVGVSGPDNDWAILLNDATGAAEYFKIEDSGAGTSPFYIAGGAPDRQRDLFVPVKGAGQLVGRAVRDQSAPIDDQNAIARGLNFGQYVRG